MGRLSDRQVFYAIVLPADSTLGSTTADRSPRALLKVVQNDIEDGHKPSRDSILRKLLDRVQELIGEVISVDENGNIFIY